MISKEEISAIALQKNLDSSQIEKDYILGWMLASISQNKLLNSSWVFKGGTCIRKCYYEDYRYSEDLDFTIIKSQVMDVQTIHKHVDSVCQYITKQTGIEFDNQRTIFEANQNPKGQLVIKGRVYYKGPTSPSAPRQWPRIKFDLTSDEIIVEKPEELRILHPYSDNQSIMNSRILTYSLYELLAEKIRALFERTRPRDLYDVVELFRANKNLDNRRLIEVIIKKCHFKRIDDLGLDKLKMEACESGWETQLSHQLVYLPDYSQYYSAFVKIHSSLQLDLVFKEEGYSTN